VRERRGPFRKTDLSTLGGGPVSAGVSGAGGSGWIDAPLLGDDPEVEQVMVVEPLQRRGTICRIFRRSTLKLPNSLNGARRGITACWSVKCRKRSERCARGWREPETPWRSWCSPSSTGGAPGAGGCDGSGVIQVAGTWRRAGANGWPSQFVVRYWIPRGSVGPLSLDA